VTEEVLVDDAQAPSREKLVGSASELVPLLQANALWTEENRRLREESIEALADAGLFKMRVPKRYGGYEVDSRTLVEVLTRLGSGCGSTSWNVAVWSITGWIACLFPDHVQDEVFATPDVRVCGTLPASAHFELAGGRRMGGGNRKRPPAASCHIRLGGQELDTHVPTRDELVRRAAELTPLLQANALWNEQHRCLHPDNIEAMAKAGIYRMRMPRRYGGYESDLRTVVDVLTQLGQGDGSTAWATAVWTINAWVISLFPDEVQDEVFTTPDARFCGILSPNSTVVPVNGGYVVNGQWGYNTGFLHSHWNMLSGMHTAPGEDPYPIITVIPTAKLDHLDDWKTVGLQGTGSVTTVAKDVFVPAEFALPMGPVLMGQYPTRLNANSPIYRPPLLQAGAVPMNGVMVGLAKAAMADFRRRLPDRGVTYTFYQSQREAPITHLQIAEAAMRIDLAQFHAYRAADLVDAKGVSGEPWTLEERARVLLDSGRTCTLAKEAVDILNTASGGSSIYSNMPMQRIERDIQAIKLHGLQHASTNLELYGRIVCGLEPDTFFI